MEPKCEVDYSVPFSTNRRERRRNDCDWTLGNGTTIYYNLTIASSNCDCVAKFEPDPDIAGKGVYISFLIIAWLTCFIAAIDLYCSMSKSCNAFLFKRKYGNSSRHIRDFLSSVQKPYQIPKDRHSLAKLERFIHNTPYIFRPLLRKISFLLVYPFRQPHPRAKKFAKLSLDILCDIQVVTGTAIMISGLVRLRDMSFYHQQFVLNYWFLSLNSFWAARAGVLSQDPHPDQWHYWTRTFAVWCSLVLSAVFQTIVFPRQNYTKRGSDWNPTRSRMCYLSHDTSVYEQQYLWLAGTFLYATYILLLMMFGLPFWNRDYVEKAKEETGKWEGKIQKGVEDWRDNWVFALSKPNKNGSQSSNAGTANIPFLIRVCQAVVYLLFGVPLLLWYFFTIFLDLIAWGDSDSVLLVAAYFSLAAWNTFNIIDMKYSNVSLLTESEAEWGFGQVLPVGVLGLVVLNCMDAWKESLKEPRRVLGSWSEMMKRAVDKIDVREIPSNQERSVDEMDLSERFLSKEMAMDGMELRELPGFEIKG